jgi:hypothetical protein
MNMTSKGESPRERQATPTPTPTPRHATQKKIKKIKIRK